jgi:glucose/arabinose dehydrogenase
MTPRVRVAVLAVCLALVAGIASSAGATNYVASGFSEEVVAAGLTEPTAISFFPDGRMAIAQKSGIVRLVKNGALQATPLIDISDRVNDYWDRGLIGIAVDPDPTKPHVYLLYVYENNAADYTGTKTARLARYTYSGDTASPSSEVVILGTSVGATCKNFAAGADCLPADGPSHAVGNVKFASDGTLFLTLGDASSFYTVDPDALRTQDLDSMAGKVLHITRTGQGLSSNPFWTGNASANRSKVWAYGVRNAYRFGLRPGTNMPYAGDVGWDTFEELEVAKAGANLGWPCYEGPDPQPGYASYPTCQALYDASGTEPPAPPQGTPIAKIMNPTGSGASVFVISDRDKPPVGSTDSSRQYDSYDGPNAATDDWAGYTFPEVHTFNKLVFQEGIHFGDGGWFNTLTVQVRQNGTWVNVSGLASSPAYPGNNGVSFESFTMTFTPIQGDGIRIYGAPGGSAAFISVGEIEAFYDAGGGGGGGGETSIAGQAQAVIARVTAPLGSGGPVGIIRDGVKPAVGSGDSSTQYDSWDGDNPASVDWVGYTFGEPHTFTRVVFQEGIHFWDGGWFNPPFLTVQVRQNGTWVNVSGLASSPAYPGNNGVSFESFTMTFTPIQGDGIRIYGAPGGAAAFISVAELEVFADEPGGPPPDPGTVTPVTAPLVSYSHNLMTAAVTAGSFYTGTLYPAQYQGAFIYGDFSQGWLRTLRVDSSDNLVPGSVQAFATDADGPVDIEMGPDGRIYYVAISANEVRRILFTSGNTPPTAVASANPVGGLAPLTVQFSSNGSNDPDGDPITFSWDFGDGSTGTGASPTHTYQLPNGTRVATLTVRDNRGGMATASVTIEVGNRPPAATIGSPSSTFTYRVGTVVNFSGSATDPDEGTLPASALSWQIVIHHCPGGSCHTHPFLSATGASGSFTVPDHGDQSFFELILTATDAGGLTSTVSRNIQPQTVQMTVASSPTGLQVIYDGTIGAAPLVRTTIVGSVHTLNTPSPQGSNTFVSWSDGGAQQHTVTVGTTNVTYTANFGCPVGQFKAEYFNNKTLSGTPVFTRCESAPINYSWGSGGPGNGVGNDNFSVRWRGRFGFLAGSQTFTTRSDDGVRLWVDNALVIDFWTDHGPTTRTGTRTLTAGEHEVRVEYYEAGGGATIQVSWTGSGGGSGDSNVASQAQTVIARVTAPTGSGGPLSVIRDGVKPAVGSGDSSQQFDSYDGNNAATEDWVGYTFSTAKTFTRVVFQEGIHFWDGGWFTAPPTVQVRQNGTWVNVSGLSITPAYPGNNGVNFESFTMTFSQIQGDGIRLRGTPGGAAQFISVGELEVYALSP